MGVGGEVAGVVECDSKEKGTGTLKTLGALAQTLHDFSNTA